MSTVAEWLASLGLSEYAPRFESERIEADVVPELTDEDLQGLEIPLGHRKRLLKAIRELAATAPADAENSIQGAHTAPSRHDTAERRQLTVMFTDLVGSTALSTRLDPEDLRGIINAYHRCATEQVERNGGFVAKYMGDGVLAYFGYPRAHEHDAEQAVRSALALVEAVPKLSTAAGAPLQVRVGIATGLVVVGDLIGTGAAQEQAVVGETPNLAARLQALADPGAVVIAAATRRLTGGLFEYRDLGTVALKGFGEDVHAWQVTGASVAESRFEALRATTTPLVGRDEELELLKRRWEQAKRGDGQVVLASGEPGIGKSRIAQTILERIGGEPHTRLRYFCSPHHQDSALYPSITQLERAAAFRREDTAEERLEKLEAVLAQGTNDVSAVAPLFAELLSIPTGDRYPPLNLTPQKRKEKTIQAQLAQIEGLSSRHPVLMLFEDVHWSDPTTRESLDLLVDRAPSLRVLVIITFRPEFAPPWIGRPHVTMLALNRLSPRQRAAMIAEVTGGKSLPKEIADQIVDRTDGVPLFIEELTKNVLESGIVTDAGDRYAVAGTVTPLAIPTSLHASLLARLDRLAPTREIAQIGAALGRSFSHELISAVAQMPNRQIDEGLAQLVGAELIFRRGTPPDAEYTFKHALVQDAAYDTLLRSRRQQLHARIAATLETKFEDLVQTQPEMLARHCAEAGFADKAVTYCRQAGRQAMARSAMTEAVAQLRRGLELLAGISDATTRTERELELQIDLSNALIATKAWSARERGDALARARQLGEQLNRTDLLGPILLGLTGFCQVRAELDQAERYSEEMRRLGEGQNDITWQFFGWSQMGTVCFYRAEFIEARARYEKALEFWAPSHNAFTPDGPRVHLLIHLGRTLATLGCLDQARARRSEALAEARQSSPLILIWALWQLWLLDWAVEGTAAVPTTLRWAEEVTGLAADLGFLLAAVCGKVMRGWCLGVTARAAEGIPLLIEGLGVTDVTGTKMLVPFMHTVIADVHGIAGQSAEGLERLDTAVQLMETTQERWAEAEMHRVRGDLLVCGEQTAAAEESYRRALDTARGQDAKLWEVKGATSLARLWRDQGKRAEARDLLAPVYGSFTEGLDAPVLKEAKALLEQLA